ncbi:MAG: ATP-binding protein [Methanomicrobiales archaeon HGW-Methanomicrobiales-2]|jgi:predicted secreted hydrolase|nr:MAG: ATP-binding protein [Methanomicrobiales archaeon HGW-Methanomicrobiales-2]
MVDLDPDTKENIARALWMSEYTPESIPPDVMNRLGDAKNNRTAFGERMRRRLADLLANPERFTPDYTDRYTMLCNHARELSAHQAYAMTGLLGQDSVRGYQELPPQIAFTFPDDDRPQFPYQVGWHFFVGTASDVHGREFGIQFMFWSYSLLPPDMARSEGLSDVENQVAEVHLAVTPAGDRHYRPRPVLVAGTTGLIQFTEKPYEYAIGKNTITSLDGDSFFPVRLQAWGIDDREDVPVEIAVDITLHQTKGYVLNGDEGLAPSCGGVGTLYYSVPNLRIQPEESWLSIDGTRIPLTSGKFWYDHQWGTGFIPSGSPRSDVLRAVGLFNEQNPGGWDWMEIQFDDETEIALSSLHTNDKRAFYSRTGAEPPGTMAAGAKGLYIRQDGEYEPINAGIRVTDWVRSVVADGPYLATDTWYPNRMEVTVQENAVPDEKKHFVMVPIVTTGQQGFFAAGPQYSEGAVIIESADGKRMGVGFLESTGYVDARRQSLLLAGLPDADEMVRLVSPPAVPDSMKAEAMALLKEPENVSKLMEELAKCKGL